MSAHARDGVARSTGADGAMQPGAEDGVDDQVVGCVEALAFVAVNDHGALAGLEIPARHAAAALVGALAGDQVALGVELQPVGLVAVGGEHGRLFGLGVEA